MRAGPAPINRGEPMIPKRLTWKSALVWLALTILAGGVCGLSGIFLYLNPQIPTAESYRHVKLQTPLRVFSEDGALLGEFGERRLIPVTLDEVPPLFLRAVLDTEDKRFYEHSGIDFISLSNDVIGLLHDLVTDGSLSGGASTITMQLARNVSFTLERRVLRKLKEMLLALKVERELTKDEILELYVNVVPFGKRAYGAEAAARTYYGQPLRELSLPQLAMLAGIPQAPTAGNPVNGPERALRRRNLVLSRMYSQGSIDEAQYRTAVDTPITARVFSREVDVPAPFAAEWVRQQLIGRFPDLYTGGYEVFTTLRGPLQKAATVALRKGLTGYDRRHGYRGPERRFASAGEAVDALAGQSVYAGLAPAAVVEVAEDHFLAAFADGGSAIVPLEAMRWARPFIGVDARGPAPETPAEVVQAGDLIRLQAGEEGWRLAQLPQIQGALVSIDPNTGGVLALDGGFDFAMNQYNHALQAARQPGSGFKPFVYSAALHKGITPASIFMDAPLVFDDSNLESQYRPDNDNNRYNGPTRLREGLYRSINLVSMRVLIEIGAGPTLDYVRRFGFDTSTFPRNTQLAIGGGTMAVTPMEMAAAYAVFANGGYGVTPYIVGRVLDINGNTVFQASHPQVCRACDEAPAELPEQEPANLEDLFAEQGKTPVEPAVRVVDERNAFIMHSMLGDVIRRGTGRRALALERDDLAGKTGTTNDAADTWFNGYNPDVVTTVWVGFPNHSPLGEREYGSSTPLPIWIDYMDVALDERSESFPAQPPGVLTMKIDPATGELAASDQEEAIFEYFLAEYAPHAGSRDGADTPPGAEREIKPEDIF